MHSLNFQFPGRAPSETKRPLRAETGQSFAPLIGAAEANAKGAYEQTQETIQSKRAGNHHRNAPAVSICYQSTGGLVSRQHD